MEKLRKFIVGKNRKGCFKPFSATFLLGVMVLIGLFSINFVSAAVKDDSVSFWKFEETTGDYIDEQGVNNLTFVDGTRGVTGYENLGYGLDGDDDYSYAETGSINEIKNNISISAWVYPNLTGRAMITSAQGSGEGDFVNLRINDSSAFEFCLELDTAGFTCAVGDVTTEAWHHLVGIFNGTDVKLYVDNSLEATTNTGGDTIKNTTNNFTIGRRTDGAYSYNGTVDEIGIWNEVLSESEINNLYGSQIDIDLISPADETKTNEDPIQFNATLTPHEVNLTNATLHVWDSTGLWKTNTTTLSGNSSTTVNRYISDWSAENYEWNFKACYENSSTGDFINCSWASSNYSLDWQPFEEVAETHESIVYETSNQSFQLNITTLEEVLSVSSSLFYNNTEYVSDVDCESGSCTIDNEFDIPLIETTEKQNRSFYWQVNVFDGSSEASFNSSTYWQNSTRIHLEECGGSYTTTALNFTAYNEKNLSRINPYNFYGTFEYWMGSGDVKRNVSLNKNSTAEAILCLSPEDKTFYTDATINYDFYNDNITYVKRHYYFDEAEISNSTQNISLYLLNAEDSTTFIQEVEDQQTEAVAGALIYVQRYYPEDGTFRTVQIGKTDDNGKSTGFYEVEDAEYKHIIMLNGEVVLSTEKGIVVGESVPYTLIFRIGDASEYPWKRFENSTVVTSLTFNSSTNITTFSWTDTSGATSIGRLIVYQIKHSTDDLLICNETASFSSATLTCNITGYSGTFKAYGYLGSSDTLSDTLQFLVSAAKDIFGNTGLLLGWFIILTASLAFIWNPTAMLISYNVASIFVTIIGLISLSPVFIFSMLGISIILIIFLKT